MRTVTKIYNIYKYNELSEKGKEKVKQWYLNDTDRTYIFSDMVNLDLQELFPNSDLTVQYSLASCQGDGLNIYGKLEAKDVFDCLEKGKAGDQFKDLKDLLLTEKEKRTILHYADYCGDINLPMNNRYCYSLADRIEVADDWSWELEMNEYKNINYEVMNKFEKLVRKMFSILNRDWEDRGYEFFYEISDEDLDECCEANDWEFLEDGTFY